MQSLPTKNIKKILFSVKLDLMNFFYNLFQVKNDLLQKHKDKRLFSKRSRYAIAAILDFACIVLILINVQKPIQRLISPLVSSIQNFYSQNQIKTTPERFAFAPGHARNKYDDIDFAGLNYLAFFDVLVSEDGGLNKESRGYNNFKSEENASLIEKAHLYNTKVLLTITQFENEVIRDILDNEEKRQSTIEDVIAEVEESGIDGVVVDLEYKGNISTHYQEKFSSFIADLSSQMHSKLPDSKVTVVIPASDTSGLYDIKTLSEKSDKILVLASDFIVPEVENSEPKTPVYGFKEDEYWKEVSKGLDNFSSASKEKLVLERAWYGNGDNYPLYRPTGKPVEESEIEPAHVLLDRDTVERLVSGVPAKAREAARKNIPLIGKALEEEGILDSNVLAYALATIEHETDGTFQPLEEIQGRMSARRLGYEGGMNYFGRGFIQLTHLRNYRMVGERIGMGEELAKNPNLAEDPKIAAKILAAFFKDNNVANLASRGQFYAARTPINPDWNDEKVAMLAWKYEEGLYGDF